MTQLHAYSGLPEDRTQLYADAVQLLLQRWEGRLGKESGVLEALNIPGLKMNDLKEGLYQVAFCAHQQCATSEGTADISEGDLRGWLAPFSGQRLEKSGRISSTTSASAPGCSSATSRMPTPFPTAPSRSSWLPAAWPRGMIFPPPPPQLVQQDWDRWREVFILAVGYAARTDRLWSAIAALDNLLPQTIAEVPAPQPADWRNAMLAGEALMRGWFGQRPA